MKAPPKVFVSATSGDLRSVRLMVRDALLSIGCHPVLQDHFGPDYREVRKMLEQRIAECQALIHIVGFRYGAEPDPAQLPPGTPRHSYTQMEYDLGRALQRKRGDQRFRVYTFVCPEGFPFDAELDVESDEKRGLQQAHRQAILGGEILYETPTDVAALKERIHALQEEAWDLWLEWDQPAPAPAPARSGIGLAAISAGTGMIMGGILSWVYSLTNYSLTNTTSYPSMPPDTQSAPVPVEGSGNGAEEPSSPTKTPILYSFPWPPPEASATTVIPRESLLTSLYNQGKSLAYTLNDANNSLWKALRSAGYFEYSYYSIPNGFALVTKLEHINKDGTPKGEALRWNIEPRETDDFSLKNYLKALFLAKQGLYRVIVFAVTSEPFNQKPDPVSPLRAQRWLTFGNQSLPYEIAKSEFTLSHNCTALIYEFEKSDLQKEGRLLVPSNISAMTHITNSGIGASFR